jgi:thymidylate synthase ThyX
MGEMDHTTLTRHMNSWEHKNGWCKLLEDERAYVESCFAGRTLQQVLEGITFYVTVDGCSRAFTHQFVRTRLGAGFMQHGGRDNDWRQRGFTFPETVARACDANSIKLRNDLAGDMPSTEFPGSINGRVVPIVDWTPIMNLLKSEADVHGLEELPELRHVLERYLEQGKEIYAALVDAGIPWQDARRFLWMGTQTYIHGEYNFVALKGVLGNRLEFIMDWEINCVCQLLLREITMKCPPIFAKYLGSHSDAAKIAKFSRLESWPADGKWPVPDDAKGLDRMHRPEQMPFFVLSPESMAGGPIKWLWTNGSYGDAVRQMP